MTTTPDDTSFRRRHADHRATRAERRARFRAAHHDHAPWFFGMLLIAMGLVFLLDNLDIVRARFIFRHFWPAVVLVFGLSRLIFGRGGERVFGAFAAAFGGLWLADRLLDWDINVAGVFWPLILIGWGIHILFKRRHGWHQHTWVPPGPPAPGSPSASAPMSTPGGERPMQDAAAEAAGNVEDRDSPDASAMVREVAILAGIERKNVSQAFHGGSITAVMGYVELDLRECRLAGGVATITLQVVMGQVVLRIPRGWVVDSRLGAVLANFEDQTDTSVSGPEARLLLDGSLFMGHAEIRH